MEQGHGDTKARAAEDDGTGMFSRGDKDAKLAMVRQIFSDEEMLWSYFIEIKK